MFKYISHFSLVNHIRLLVVQSVLIFTKVDVMSIEIVCLNFCSFVLIFVLFFLLIHARLLFSSFTLYLPVSEWMHCLPMSEKKESF